LLEENQRVSQEKKRKKLLRSSFPPAEYKYSHAALYDKMHAQVKIDVSPLTGGFGGILTQFIP